MRWLKCCVGASTISSGHPSISPRSSSRTTSTLTVHLFTSSPTLQPADKNSDIVRNCDFEILYPRITQVIAPKINAPRDVLISERDHSTVRETRTMLKVDVCDRVMLWK